MNHILWIPFVLQAVAIIADEFYFHHRREMPKWERIGHPLDTLLTLCCYLFIYHYEPTAGHLRIYVVICVLSSLLITKDEWEHKKYCTPAENWLHAILFILHPIAFFIAGYLWFQGDAASLFLVQILLVQILLMSAFLLYQIFYWNRFKFHRGTGVVINNEIYNDLGERWYTAQDDPVALLRAESKLKAPWVYDQILQHFSNIQKPSVLDVGCGAGFLSNALAKKGLAVTGVDLSQASLEVAIRHDDSKTVKYLKADARHLPFPDQSFEVITAMDFLEHVEDPADLIREFSRVLKTNGLLIYHTFNRNMVAYLIIIKCVEWFVKNTPRHMHILRLFIKPREIIRYCQQANLQTVLQIGIRPDYRTFSIRDIKSGIVPMGLQFKFTPSLLLSYVGVARKNH